MSEFRAVTECKKYLVRKGPSLRPKEETLLRGLHGERRTWRKRIVNGIIEDRICKVQGVSDPSKIDWDAVDWVKVITLILSILLMFL